MGALKGITTKGIIGSFYAALDQDLGLAWIDSLSQLIESDQEKETYKWLGQVPQMRKKHGGKQAKELNVSDYTITNEEYEATLKIDKADRRRDKTGQILVRVRELATRVKAHWWKLLADLIIAGETDLCYDGQAFFDTDHSEGDSGTQKNLLTATEVTQLDVTTATAPTPDEMSKAILGVIAYMQNYKDDQGEYLNENAQQFTVITGANNIGLAAKQAIKDKRLDTGSGSRDNLLITDEFSVTSLMSPRFADWTTKFAVVRTDSPAKAFIRQNEVDVEMTALAEGSEYEFHNSAHLFSAEACRNAGYGFWQYASKSTLS